MDIGWLQTPTTILPDKWAHGIQWIQSCYLSQLVWIVWKLLLLQTSCWKQSEIMFPYILSTPLVFKFQLVVYEIHIIQPERDTIMKLRAISMLIKIQPDATVCRYLFTAKSLYMFRASRHPSSGVLKTVTTATGTGHNTGTATSLHCSLIRLCWREVAVPLLWPVPEVAVTVFSTPDDGCHDARNM